MNNQQKRGLSKAAYIGIFLAVAASVSIVAFALLNNVFTSQSDTDNIAPDKGYTTEIKLTDSNDYSNLKIIPGERLELKAELENKSTTNSCRVFVDVNYLSNVYKITPGAGWALVTGSNSVYVYGGETAAELGSGKSVTFTATAELIATGSDYESLTKNDLKISMTGYAVNSKASREGAKDALDDYYDSGNQEMIKALEGTE